MHFLCFLPIYGWKVKRSTPLFWIFWKIERSTPFFWIGKLKEAPPFLGFLEKLKEAPLILWKKIWTPPERSTTLFWIFLKNKRNTTLFCFLDLIFENLGGVFRIQKMVENLGVGFREPSSKLCKNPKSLKKVIKKKMCQKSSIKYKITKKN